MMVCLYEELWRSDCGLPLIFDNLGVDIRPFIKHKSTLQSGRSLQANHYLRFWNSFTLAKKMPFSQKIFSKFRDAGDRKRISGFSLTKKKSNSENRIAEVKKFWDVTFPLNILFFPNLTDLHCLAKTNDFHAKNSRCYFCGVRTGSAFASNRIDFMRCIF